MDKAYKIRGMKIRDFKTMLVDWNIATEITKTAFEKVKTDYITSAMTLEVYGKIYHGFKTTNFLYFERLDCYFYIHLNDFDNNVNISIKEL